MIGNVETLDPALPATVSTNIDEEQNVVYFNFGIPQGIKGDTGDTNLVSFEIENGMLKAYDEQGNIYNLGMVAIEPRGEYSATTSYEKLNTVLYNDSTYMALKSSLGNAPTNTEYWQLIGGGITKEYLEQQTVDNLDSTSATRPLSANQGNNLNKNKIEVFDTVALMKAANLKNNMTVKTLGYYSANDGGGALYKIKTTSSGHYETLDNSLVAELIVENNEVNVKQFGAYGDETHNDYSAFKTCFDFANDNKFSINLVNQKYKIVGNRLTLKTNLYGNGATIISNDNEDGVNLDEPLIHVVSDSEFTSTQSDNCYIFRTYPEHTNIWKRSGNTPEAALGVVPKECNAIIKNNLLYDYFFDFTNPTTEYRKIDDKISIKDIIINKTIVDSERTSYIKRNIMVERDNVLLENIKFEIIDNNTNTAPYLGLIKLNKCYNVELKNCVLPALLTYSSYSFHSSYDIKTQVENCYINGEDDCWGGTSSNGSVDITYSNCNVNRIDAHQGFFGLTVKDCFVGREGILLTGGNFANIIRCHFDGRRCIALREDYGSGFNGTIRLKDCDGSVTGNEIIYMKSTEAFDYGYDWKSPSIIIEDCHFTETDSIITILNYNVNSNSSLKWFSNMNTIKISNVTSNRNLRVFNVLPHLFGDCEIKLENLNARTGIYNSYVASATNYTVFVNANKCVVRYPKGNSMVRINGFYTNCEFLDLEFIHLNTTLCGCNLRERDSIVMGYTDSGKHLSMVNMGLLVLESAVTAWHENCYNFKSS